MPSLTWSLPVLLLFFYFLHESNAVSTRSSHLIPLNATTFDSFISSHDFVLVEFITDDCKHCTGIQEEVEHMAESLQNAEYPVSVVQFNIKELDKLGKRYPVRVAPTFMFLYKKEPSIFMKAPKVRQVLFWALKRTGPPALKASSYDEINAIYTSEEASVVFLGAEDSQMFKEFQKAAEHFKKRVIFVYNTDPAVRTIMNERRNSIFMVMDFDEGKIRYKGNASSESIIEFVKEHQYPKIVELKNETIPEFLSRNQDLLVLFTKNSKDKSLAYFEKAKLQMATECRLGFLNMDQLDESTEQFAELFQISKEQIRKKKFPSLRLLQTDYGGYQRKLYVYPEDEPADDEYFLEWFYQYQYGKLEPFSVVDSVNREKTEELAKLKNQILNEENYEDFRNNQEKDVLVNFYSSFCGTCQEVALL